MSSFSSASVDETVSVCAVDEVVGWELSGRGKGRVCDDESTFALIGLPSVFLSSPKACSRDGSKKGCAQSWHM